MKKKKLLIVGQTPPPYHGQAIMIQNTVNHVYENLEIYHVRMNFSKDVDDVGKFKIRKIFVLFSLIYKIIYTRIRYNVKNIYYPPSGPNTTPIVRDLVVLGFTKWLFKVVIFHFRAGGISEKIETYPKVVRKIIKAVFSRPDLTIRLSSKNPDDGFYFNTLKDVIIPNGLKDFSLGFDFYEGSNTIPILLYVGILKESKGILDLLKACKTLKSKKITFKLRLVGKFESDFFKNQALSYIEEKDLIDEVAFLGVKTGDDKWQEFLKATIFCFPSFYECETFGNVLVEAMQFKLPVVATKWRGISDIVINDESGFLVEINSPKSIAAKLAELIDNEALRIRFGNSGRKLFEEKFTEKIYFSNIESQVYSVCV